MNESSQPAIQVLNSSRLCKIVNLQTNYIILFVIAVVSIIVGDDW